MEIKNVITVDNLTTESVSVKTQRVLIEDNGTETALGLPSRKAYTNSLMVVRNLKPKCKSLIFLLLSPFGVNNRKN